MSADNPYEPPAARVADRQPDVASALPRIAAALALVFASAILGMVLLEIAGAPASVRLIEHLDALGVALAAGLVGLGLWRCSPWSWWIGLLGGGGVLLQLALRVQREGRLAPEADLWFCAIVGVAFLAVLLLPRTIRAFTR